MLRVFESFFRKYLSSDEAVILLLLLAAAIMAVALVGELLAPVIASVVIAFVLQGLVSKLVRREMPELLAVTLVFLLFVGALVGFLLVLLPLVWGQLTSLMAELPGVLASLHLHINLLPEQYPQLVSAETVQSLYQQIKGEAGGMTQQILSLSIKSIPNILAIMIYLVLVPILVFFCLKDRRIILESMTRLLPQDRQMMVRIWKEMNEQFANYIRGKVVEILIVGGATYVAFVLMGMNYSALLGLVVGLSVLIPYIGAVVVTVPVVLIGLFQWGFGPDFYWMLTIYLVIQALDGNILVPLLFSEVVNLHPIAIIVAVLFFGGIWGVWGVFFAIPLATLLKAIFSAWPTNVSHADVSS